MGTALLVFHLAIEKGAQLKQIVDVDLSFISFDENDGDQLTSENETDSDNDEADEWHDASTQISLRHFYVQTLKYRLNSARI
jgi:hypothetical protein